MIWLVEDDPSIGASLVRTLEAEGHDVAWARGAAEAEAMNGDPTCCCSISASPTATASTYAGHCPHATRMRTIILTARSSEIDVVVGLDAGAVDYIAKPFRLAELLARIRAHLRDRTMVHDDSHDHLVVGELLIEPGPRRVSLAGREIGLRPKEFDLLARLAMAAGSVVHRDVLMRDVWDEHWAGNTKTLDVHIAALRRRLGEEPNEPSRIVTIRGVGYRLEAS